MITGIIKNARIGAHDHYGVALTFETYVDEHSAAGQAIRLEDAKEILKRVDSVDQLNGKPCWVDNSRPGLLIFDKLWDRF